MLTSKVTDPDTLTDMRHNIEKIWNVDMGWNVIVKDYIRCYNDKLKVEKKKGSSQE